MKTNLNDIWLNRKAIIEGITNTIFKKEHIEEIAAERMSICRECPDIDLIGTNCLVSNTEPCCSHCGCSLKLKVRSLSSECANEQNVKWPALTSQEKEDALKKKINYKNPI